MATLKKLGQNIKKKALNKRVAQRTKATVAEIAQSAGKSYMKKSPNAAFGRAVERAATSKQSVFKKAKTQAKKTVKTARAMSYLQNRPETSLMKSGRTRELAKAIKKKK